MEPVPGNDASPPLTGFFPHCHELINYAVHLRVSNKSGGWRRGSRWADRGRVSPHVSRNHTSPVVYRHLLRGVQGCVARGCRLVATRYGREKKPFS